MYKDIIFHYKQKAVKRKRTNLAAINGVVNQNEQSINKHINHKESQIMWECEDMVYPERNQINKLMVLHLLELTYRILFKLYIYRG